MSTRSKPAGQSPAQGREPGGSRSVLSTVASAMFVGGCVAICGLCGAGVYFFQPDARDDPDAVAPLVAEMLNVTVPADFQPRGVIEWNLAFVMSLRGAYYEMPDAESEGMLMFVEVGSWRGTEPDVQAHIEQALREKGGGVRELELVGDVEQRPLQVRGEDVRFTFETRRDPATDHTYRVIEGVVDGNNGAQIWVGLSVREQWTRNGDGRTSIDDVAEELIESIR